ncbi:phage antirepressor KilAC domain-containing protein [Paenibacillus vini]|uniref:Bro-N domain-containing protein n=1 Tax=Paenibacillus vini TaxID=1476024 RepID=A0ABQ4MH13_9BACL|nr:phage antirepressor KilAC domain-containing protein [Paenibacillus vini]GIP55266.1 hypothetical protein J42TS3_43010 [Paenibacillus vini]
METNSSQVFSHDRFGSVCVTLVDGKEMFGATQIASALGYVNPQKAIRDHCCDDGCTIRSVTDSLGRTQQMKFISEGNVYRLIVRSKLPAAEQFERWLFDEVIPTIRKHGAYIAPTKLEEMIRDPDVMIQLLTELKREQQERARLQLETTRQAEVIEEQAERLTYLDEIMRSDDTLTITQIAADYGMTAAKLNAALKEAGVQRKTGGQWILCARYLRQGLTKSVTHAIPLETGGTKTVLHTRWTQAGRLLIHRVLESCGIQANQDRGIDAGVLVIRPAAQVERREPTEIKVSLRINA